MSYEVQQYMPTTGWTNTWFAADEFDRLDLETFATREEAQQALDQHLEQLADEFAAGQIGRLPGRHEFRVQYIFLNALPALSLTHPAMENCYE